MKPENLGMRILQKYKADAVQIETDLMGAEFAVAGFRETYSKMDADERNKMRELRWMRDPQVDQWVFVN